MWFSLFSIVLGIALGLGLGSLILADQSEKVGL